MIKSRRMLQQIDFSQKKSMSKYVLILMNTGFSARAPRRDLECFIQLATSVDKLIAGGEQSANIYKFKEHILRGSYNILQPDLRVGDIGICGIRQLAIFADYFSRIIILHISSLENVALKLPATS